MKRMYYYAIILIIILTFGFYFFYCDINEKNRRFLLDYNIVIDTKSCLTEQVCIPSEFDTMYDNYNLLQSESGFDISKYKGKTLTKYSYIIQNYPENDVVYVNIFYYKGNVVAGEIVCPSINGYIKPLNYLIKAKHFDNIPNSD